MSVIKTELRNKRMKEARTSLDKAVQERPLVSGDEKILVLGANGQVAGYLVPELQRYYGDKVLLTDVKADEEKNIQVLSVTAPDTIRNFIKKNNVKVIINLAALLSGASAKHPLLAKKINFDAPKDIMRIADEEGVRKVFTPSSIAVMGKSSTNGGNVAPLEAATYPNRSPYGDAKRALEADSQYYSNNNGLQALCLRYGGVLACKEPPSDGTTEEIDRMVVAAAEFKAKNGEKLHYSDNGVYHPLIPPEATFPMIDGRSVGLETMRYLHADPKKIRGHEAHYHLAEYSASMGAVTNLLTRLAPGFEVKYPADRSKYDQDKLNFTEDWPQKVDTVPSREAWEMQQPITMAQSVQYHFDRLVEHFRRQQLESLGANVSASTGTVLM